MTTLLLPKHIAIVMDGNGRWAKKRFLPRLSGHRAGVKAARGIVKFCVERKIPVLSLFAFSTENWSRPGKEVNNLMELFFAALKKEFKILHEQDIQLRFIGDRSRFNPKLHGKITEVENLTRDNKGLVLMIAADYGGQWDICQAVQQLVKESLSGQLSTGDITPAQINQRLSFADLADPDLFIRTGGEIRVSNFMLWQLAYAELYFTDTLWPDFNEEAFDKALLYFSGRERRFGNSK
jgi:undecaprenyl diphosphate synthase